MIQLQKFQSEISLEAVLKLLILFSLVLIGYGRGLWEVFNFVWVTPEAQYILAVPPILIFFIYKKRRSLLAFHRNSLRTDIVGFCLCSLALMMSVWGLYSFYSLQLNVLSLPLFVAGSVLLLFGFPALRSLAFPVLLLIFLTPPPSELFTTLGSGLTVFTANASYSILSFFRFPVQLSEGANLTVFTNHGDPVSLTVGLPCSGLYSFLGFAFFAVIFAYLSSGSLLKKTVFSIVGLIFIYSLNILRVCLLVIVALATGLSEAFSIIHSYSGMMILFVGVLLWLFTGEKLFRISILQRPDSVRVRALLTRKKVNWKRLLIVFLTLSLLVFLIGQSLVHSYSAGNISSFDFDSSTGNVKNIFHYNESLSYEFLYRDSTVEKELGLEDVAYYSFFGNNTSQTSAILEISDAQSLFHTWEGCIYHQQFETQVEKDFYTTIYDNGSSLIIAEVLIVNIPALNQSAALVYWFDDLSFNVTGKTQGLSVDLTLVQYFTGTYNLNSSVSIDASAEELITMAKEIAVYWSPYRIPPQVLIVDLYNVKEAITTTLCAAFIFTLSTWGITMRRDRRNPKSNPESHSRARRQRIMQSACSHVTANGCLRLEHTIKRRRSEQNKSWKSLVSSFC